MDDQKSDSDRYIKHLVVSFVIVSRVKHETNRSASYVSYCNVRAANISITTSYSVITCLGKVFLVDNLTF